jgi:hypothetical protein
VRLGQTALRNITEFKYLGIIFDIKLSWRLHVEEAKIPRKGYFMKIIAGQSWGAHSA